MGNSSFVPVGSDHLSNVRLLSRRRDAEMKDCSSIQNALKLDQIFCIMTQCKQKNNLSNFHFAFALPPRLVYPLQLPGTKNTSSFASLLEKCLSFIPRSLTMLRRNPDYNLSRPLSLFPSPLTCDHRRRPALKNAKP